MYEYTDKVIRDLNRTYLRLFRRLKLLKFDELNVVTAVSDVYEKVEKLAKKRYRDIAIHAYIFAMLLLYDAGYDVTVPEPKDVPLGEDWLEDYLEETNPVTLYRFGSETERKKQRLIEALAVSRKRGAEIDKALRFWSLQSTQYADGVTDAAAMRAYRDAGVEYVQWVTQKDGKVCADCDALNGKVFPIDEAPDKLHWRCRCYYVPAAKQ